MRVIFANATPASARHLRVLVFSLWVFQVTLCPLTMLSEIPLESLDPALDPRPRGGKTDQDRELSVCQILLIPEIPVGRDQKLVSLPFSSVQQLPVLYFRPSAFEGSVDSMLRQVVAKWGGSALIEKHSHGQGEPIAAAASWSRTVSTCDRLTPGNHSRNSWTEAPARLATKGQFVGFTIRRRVHPGESFCSPRCQLWDDVSPDELECLQHGTCGTV